MAFGLRRGTVSAENKITISAIEHNDVVDAQIEMNCDLLINKIMYYLSQLPLQLSFEMMKPKLY